MIAPLSFVVFNLGVFNLAVFNLVLGPITFLAPLALLGLLVLPVIWWILRVTPPQPKRAEFPPLQILSDVMTEEETPDSTPWWLLLFRLFLAGLIAVALAEPILGGNEDSTARPLTLVIDNDWAAAPSWSVMMKDAEARITRARRDNQDVLLITTTAPDKTTGFVPAQEAMQRLKSLSPIAVTPPRNSAANALGSFDITASDAIWISSGLSYDDAGTEALGEALSAAARATRIAPLPTKSVIIPGEVSETGSGFRAVWYNPSATAREIDITAHDRAGNVIARGTIIFALGNPRSEIEFELPADLRNRVSILRAVGLPSAGAVKLLDDSWGRPLVGILTAGKDNASPLLSEPFYTEKALEPYADVFTGTLDTLLPLAPSIIIMPDAARIEDEALTEFVETGGLLIRFAGPKLATRPDGLLPVLLRDGDRALGGALTWEDPQTLASFTTDSPFFGLAIPAEVSVTQQVMAEPGAQTDAATWARLSDGSPIVTSAPRGLGRVVLFHVTAGPEWSNLALGGLYVNMLRRVLPLANSRPAQVQSTDGDWAPDRVINGFGRLVAPTITASSLPDARFDDAPISERHPAGLYKQGVRRKARNMVSAPETLSPIGTLSGVTLASFETATERTLGGLLLTFALMLLAVDVLISLLSSGRMGYLKPKFGGAAATIGLGGMLLAGITLAPMDSAAQDAPYDDNTPQAVSDALGLHLAYVITGNSTTDELSEAALTTLSLELTRRTTIEPTGVRGVNIERDPLAFYPFLYYPVSRDASELSDAASTALNAYMAGGGTIVFDTRDQGDRALLGNYVHPGLAAVTKDLDIPRIAPVPDDHVLTKSFFLISQYPGRWANGTVWVDKNPQGTAQDGVSSVIIGSNDWAAGWAQDEDGQTLIRLEDDMQRQREFAIRFGVNLAMYTLAGNYKSDQVHGAALVERLGRQQRRIQNIPPETPEQGEPPRRGGGR